MDFNKSFVEEKAREIRALTMDSIGKLGVGHVGGCLSIADVLAVLYHSEMNIDPKEPKKEGRDRFVLSKGHGGPALYATLVSKGYFDRALLDTLNEFGTNLPSHCDMNRTVGIDMTTGSLGQGFSCAVGVAVGSKIRKDDATIYTLIGDGESQEGQIWEAAMLASSKQLNNLIAFTDYNNMQIDGLTESINDLGNLEAKWAAFGWFAQTIPGHDVEAIHETIQKAQAQNEKPSMIILKTIKGKGVGFVEKAGVTSHNMPVTEEQRIEALKELQYAEV